MANQTLTAVVLQETFTWQVDVTASDLAIAAMRKGYQEWLQDAASTAKPSDDTAETATRDDRLNAARARDQKIQAGTYQPGSGGGGGGAKLSFAERAERIVLGQIGRDMGKKAGVADKWARKPAVAWLDVTRQAVLAEVQQAGLSEDDVKALDLDQLVTDNLDNVKAAYAHDIAEKAKELEKAGKKTDTKKVVGISLG